MFWIVFSFVILLLGYLALPDSPITNKYAKVAARFGVVVALSYVSSFGSIVGQDNIGYSNIYNSLETFRDFTYSGIGLQSAWRVESGYEILNIFGHLLGLGFPGFLFLYSLIMNSLFVAVVFRFKKPLVGLFLFIISTSYFLETNLVRQMLAVSLFLFSLDFLEKKKIFFYVALIIVGALIHTSILFLLLLIFIPYINLQKQNKLLLIILGILWGYSLISIFIPGFSPLPSFVVDMLSTTSYSRFVNGSDNAGASIGSNYIYNLMVLLFFVFNKKRICLYDIIFILGCVMINFSISLSPIYRFALFFTTLYPVYLYTLVHNITVNDKQLRQILLVFLFVFYVVYELGNNYIIKGSNPLGTDFYPLNQFFV